jgi:hypothetical protein
MHPETYAPEDLAARGLALAQQICAWDAHPAPLAYSKVLPIPEVIPDGQDELPAVQVDEERFEPEPERVRVRANVWRLCAEVSVEHAEETGQLMAWRNRTEAVHRGEPEVTREEAIATATGVVGTLPPNADGPSVLEIGNDPDQKVHQVSWSHLIPGNVLVDGDLLLCRVNAATGKPYTLFRKWRTVPPEQTGDD